MSLYLVENNIEPVLDRYWHDGTAVADEQFRQLLELPSWSNNERLQIRDTDRLAGYVHAGDDHRGWPYDSHYRTVANTIASPDGFNMPDIRLVTAALLHDTIEDHPGRVIGYYNLWGRSRHLTMNMPCVIMPGNIEQRRRIAAWMIGLDFGKQVSDLVVAVSQPVDRYEGDDVAAKLEARLAILRIMSKTPEGCIIKVADSISHDVNDGHPDDTSPDRVSYLEQKNYGSRLVLAARVEQPDVQSIIPASGKAFIRRKWAGYGITMAA